MDADTTEALAHQHGQFMALEALVIALLAAMPPGMQARVATAWPIEAESIRVAHLASTASEAASEAFEATVENLSELLTLTRSST